jgi:transposase
MRMAPLSEAQRDELDRLYRTTKDPRLRTRAQLVLLAGEQGRTVPEIAEIVRESENTIWRWLKRYQAEGIEGLKDAPRSGRPVQVTAGFQTQLVAAVRRRPRSLELPYSLWTLQRLADYMAEQTGTRVVAETVRQILKKHDIVLSRPQHKVSSPDPEYQVKKRRSTTREMA